MSLRRAWAALRPANIVVTPTELGAGERLWEQPEELLDRFLLEKVPSPSGVVHHLFRRR